ncbi:MAG: WYL domain-containing protein [Oscillospiraceae bacterium]
MEPRHGKPLVDILWTLGQAIQTHSEIEADYQTQTGEKKHRRLQPVGLMCSEFYFYLAAFLKNVDRNEEFEYPEDPYPTIYRVDRLEQIQVQSEHFSSHIVSAFQKGNFESGSNSCTEGGADGSFSVSGTVGGSVLTACPQRRLSASGTDA